MSPHDVKSDPPLTPEQLMVVERLSSAEVLAIDKALLSLASTRWQKVSSIVGRVMHDQALRYPDIPDIYYAQRVRLFVEKEILVAQGYLDCMRYGEVRLTDLHELTNEP